MKNYNYLSDAFEFQLRLSPSHVKSLKKVQKRTDQYNLSSALEPGSIRTAIKGFGMLLPALWGMFRYRNLTEVRALIIGGEVESFNENIINESEVLVKIKLKNHA